VSLFLGFPGGSDSKDSTYNAGDGGLILGEIFIGEREKQENYWWDVLCWSKCKTLLIFYLVAFHPNGPLI